MTITLYVILETPLQKLKHEKWLTPRFSCKSYQVLRLAAPKKYQNPIEKYNSTPPAYHPNPPFIINYPLFPV